MVTYAPTSYESTLKNTLARKLVRTHQSKHTFCHLTCSFRTLKIHYCRHWTYLYVHTHLFLSAVVMVMLTATTVVMVMLAATAVVMVMLTAATAAAMVITTFTM